MTKLPIMCNQSVGLTLSFSQYLSLAVLAKPSFEIAALIIIKNLIKNVFVRE